MYTEENFGQATSCLLVYDALYGQNGFWPKAETVPAEKIEEITTGLAAYERALRALPLLPEYVAVQHNATVAILEAIRSDPDLWRLISEWPSLETPFPEYSYVRPVTDEFHAAIVERLPLLQRVADLHACQQGIEPARLETYRSESMQCPPGQVHGYENGRIGHPSGSAWFGDFGEFVASLVHEGSHHFQNSLIIRLEEGELESGSWQFWQARIFQNDRLGGRPVDPRSYMPEKFGGNDEPYYAALMAYRQCPTERDPDHFCLVAGGQMREWQGLPRRSRQVDAVEKGIG